ncbi:MAG: RNHCP domain-containing protein [Planctomycetota bacterium]|jgi:hypothetical protein
MPRTSSRDAREETPSSGAFLCEYCKTTVPGNAPGTQHRNHCPNCLWSLHVDLRTGDRRSGCRGLMEPVGIATRYNGEWALIHRCRDCGTLRMNRTAGDDNPLPLLSLAVRPLGRPPFPLDQLRELSVGEKGGRP